MPRHVYAVIVDCNDQSNRVEAACEAFASMLRSREWAEVRDVAVSIDVPMLQDERKQDPERTTPEIRLVES